MDKLSKQNRSQPLYLFKKVGHFVYFLCLLGNRGASCQPSCKLEPGGARASVASVLKGSCEDIDVLA